MTNTTPEDWVLIEAAKQSGYIGHIDVHRHSYSVIRVFRALCDMIAKHEQKPDDRKLLCAREAARLWGHSDEDFTIDEACLRAIELYLEGFGE